MSFGLLLLRRSLKWVCVNQAGAAQIGVNLRAEGKDDESVFVVRYLYCFSTDFGPILD